MSNPASAIFFMSAASQRTTNGGVIAATADGMTSFEGEAGKALRRRGISGDIRFEQLPHVFSAGTAQGGGLAVQLRQE